MDERLKKRIFAFRFAGFVNAALGFYVLFQGRTFLAPGTWLLLLALFFGFAAVDFWFPKALKKKWLEEQARLAAGREQAARREPGDEGNKR